MIVANEAGRMMGLNINVSGGNLPVTKGDLHFCLDAPGNGYHTSNSLNVKGWVVHRSKSISRIRCYMDCGKEIDSADLSELRPGVLKAFPEYPDAGLAGFNLILKGLSPSRIRVVAEFECGMQELLETIELSKLKQPKLMFMHIAKTAGTSVNSYFSAQYPAELTATHVESNPLFRKDPKWAHELEFISGHIVFSEFEQRLDLSEFFKVTLVREPFAHLRSHLAWIRHLTAPELEQHLKSYPEYIQKLAAKLRDTDFHDPSMLSRLVESLHGLELHLLDNCQTRYFSAPIQNSRVGQEDFDRATETLHQFDFVGITEDTDIFLSEVSRILGFEKPLPKARGNVAQSYFELDITSRRVKDILWPLVRFDSKIYKNVVKMRSNPTTG